jgi:hypothetical protein
MRFLVSGNLLRFTGFRDTIPIPAATIEEGLQRLVEQHPDLRPVLFDGEGRFRQVHRLFLNDQSLDSTALGSAAGPDDDVTILTAIAGG